MMNSQHSHTTTTTAHSFNVATKSFLQKLLAACINYKTKCLLLFAGSPSRNQILPFSSSKPSVSSYTCTVGMHSVFS